MEGFGFMFERWRTGVLPIAAREVADGGGGGRGILLFLGGLVLRIGVGFGSGIDDDNGGGFIQLS